MNLIRPNLNRLTGPALGLLAFAMYAICAGLSLRLVLQPESITPVWPANGAAIALLLLWPRRMWPWIIGGVALAFIPANIGVARSLPPTILFAVANLIECIAAALLLTKLSPTITRFNTTRHFAVLLLVVVSSCSLSGCFAGLIASEMGHIPSFTHFWRIWFTGDALGILAVTPVILSAFHRQINRQCSAGRAELACLFILSISCILWIFTLEPTRSLSLLNRPFVITVPFLIWAGLRFNIFITSLISLLFSIIAVLCTVTGKGPFSVGYETPQDTLIVLQFVLAAWNLCGMGIAVSVNEQRLALDLLRHLEERFRLVTAGVPVAVYQTDPQGRAVYVNERWQQITGQSTQQALGAGWARVISAEDVDRAVAMWKRDVDAGVDHHNEFRVVRPDGRQRWVRTSATPLKSGDGRFLGYVGVVEDFTEEKLSAEAQRQSERRFRDLADLLPQTVFECDASGRLTFVNKDAATTFGYSPRELLAGKKLTDLAAPLDAGRVMATIENILAGHAHRGEPFTALRKNGDRFVALLYASPAVIAGQSAGVRGVIVDLTERIDAQEAERARIGRELHDDITQRLARLALDAGRLSQVSPDPAAQNTLAHIRREIIRLSQDVHGLSYRLHPAILEDLGLVQALQNECKRFTSQTGIPVALEERDTPTQISKQVQLCLFRVAQESLSNVHRHARASRVNLSLLGVDGGLQLAIGDNGVGFDHRLLSAGKGLGLASMRERLQLLGGELDIDSTPGDGATVLAWIPLQGDWQ